MTGRRIGNVMSLVSAPMVIAFAVGCGASTETNADALVYEPTLQEGLTVDRDQISPPTSLVVRRARLCGSVATFDITEAIRWPAGSPPVYVSWWVGFDPKSPIIPPTPSEATSFDVVPCESSQLMSEQGHPVTVLVEAVVGTSPSIAYDFQRADPRFAPDGSELIFIQWALVVEGQNEGCCVSTACGMGRE
ncbi:MAG: hypothetical protein IV100_31220 [Myxococcales bacterium]|nr:hypothetical protein [Myxococcales bacterium]